MGFVNITNTPIPGSIGSIGGPGASLMTGDPNYPFLSQNIQARLDQPLAQQTPSGASQLATQMMTFAPIFMILGAANSAIGSFYSAQSQQNQLKMQAQNQAFAAEMARVNQGMARFTAGATMREGQERIGRYTMGAGQARASAKAALAARGGVLSEGAPAEVLGSMDLVKEIDKLTMSAANVRAAEAAKLQAFNIGVGATMADISAQNLQATASTIYPGLSLGTSLLGSATDIAGTWARNKRIEEMLAGVSTQRM
jgi:hypothetical protein